MKRIAVLFVHGVDIDDPDYARTPIRLLKQEFRRCLGRGAPDPEEALVFKPAHVAPVMEEQQRTLLERTCPGSSTASRARLRDAVLRASSGSIGALVPLALELAQRRTDGGVHYPAARWMLVNFVGDAIAYQITPSCRETYDELHRTYADALRALAARAGGDAPLCVIAHSFGTVISSDFFYDRETEGEQGKPLPPFRRRAATPLERGETLTWMYTMGSPMALWALRYPGARLSAPIRVPAQRMAARTELGGEWVNILDDDDLAAWPLSGLGPEYAAALTDRSVRVRAPPVQWTPLVHPYYWADRAVMAPIARKLADAWAALNARPARAAG